MSNYWVRVASRDHVRAGDFCQLGHGKALPLQQLQPCDWIIYYSPHEQSFVREESCLSLFRDEGVITLNV